MPQDINQLMQGQGNPDETAAVLAFGTKLQEGLLPKAPKMQEMGATSVPNQEGVVNQVQQEKPQPEADNKEVEKMVDSKIDDLRKEIKDTIKEEISTIKESIEDALNEDGEK